MRLIRWLRLLREAQRELGRWLARLQVQQAWRQRGVEIAATALVRVGPHAMLEIGRGTTIGPYSILDLLDDPLAAAPSASRLVIGQRVAINEFNNIRASGGEIYIGDGCLVSQFVSIIGSNHATRTGTWMRDQPWDMRKRGVVIGADVWLGAHAVVLPGVSIGAGSIVAAGAIVHESVPANTVVAGVPARVVGERR